jgi:hypothetical protein
MVNAANSLLSPRRTLAPVATMAEAGCQSGRMGRS